MYIHRLECLEVKGFTYSIHRQCAKGLLIFLKVPIKVFGRRHDMYQDTYIHKYIDSINSDIYLKLKFDVIWTLGSSYHIFHI